LSEWRGAFRVAVVSDTHGCLDSRVIDVVSDCAAAIHAGDIGGAAILDSLQPERGSVFAVAGNNDARHTWNESEWNALESLPEIHHIVFRCGVISVEHGHRVRDTRRYHEELRQRHADSALVVYGHTHVRVIDRSQSPWVINPGASGKERTKGGPSCLTVEINEREIEVFEHRFKPRTV